MNASSVRYEKAGTIYKDQIYKFMMETFRTRDPAVCSLSSFLKFTKIFPKWPDRAVHLTTVGWAD